MKYNNLWVETKDKILAANRSEEKKEGPDEKQDGGDSLALGGGGMVNHSFELKALDAQSDRQKNSNRQQRFVTINKMIISLHEI
jgi:superoxide dismutase